MAPCILFIDELEKALSGAAGSGQSDSGVSMRLFGTLLSWMNDHTSNVYLVATCNDISKMPPELSRAERFDGIVFLDLPGREQKDLIWNQYLRSFELDTEQPKPSDDDWTGAEIRACCRLAALLDVPINTSFAQCDPRSQRLRKNQLIGFALGPAVAAWMPSREEFIHFPKPNQRNAARLIAIRHLINERSSNVEFPRLACPSGFIDVLV